MMINFVALHATVGDPRLFRPKPKDHQIVHMIELWCKITRINPRMCANYKNENFVRLIKRMVKAVDKKAMSVRACEHFLLTAGLVWKAIAEQRPIDILH